MNTKFGMEMPNTCSYVTRIIQIFELDSGLDHDAKIPFFAYLEPQPNPITSKTGKEVMQHGICQNCIGKMLL